MKDINNMSDIEIMAINKMHLEDKIKQLEKELDEKDKEIEWLQNNWINKQNELTKLQDKELFKEDFTEFYVCEKHGINLDNCNCSINNANENFRIRWLLENNSKYNTLTSKGDK